MIFLCLFCIQSWLKIYFHYITLL